MRQSTRAAMVIAAGALAVGATGLAPASASAGKCGYPPGACAVYFNHGTYHRGATVRFSTDPAFSRHERVDGKLACRHHFSATEGPFRAHNHRVINSFTLPENTPKGACTLALVGRHSSSSASGSFDVRP
jgi:hypothetical protein